MDALVFEKSTGEISLKVKTIKTQDHEDFDDFFVASAPYFWTSHKIKKGNNGFLPFLISFTSKLGLEK